MSAFVKAVTTPVVVMRPIELLPLLVNHNAPSGPAVIPCGDEMVGSVKMVTVPAVVMRPIELRAGAEMLQLVNHNAPSGPAVIPNGSEMPGSVYVDTTPPV